MKIIFAVIQIFLLVLFVNFSTCLALSDKEEVKLIAHKYLDVFSTKISSFSQGMENSSKLVDYFDFSKGADLKNNEQLMASDITGKILAVQMSLNMYNIKFRKKDFYIADINITSLGEARVTVRNKRSNKWKSVITLSKINGKWLISDVF